MEQCIIFQLFNVFRVILTLNYGPLQLPPPHFLLPEDQQSRQNRVTRVTFYKTGKVRKCELCRIALAKLTCGCMLLVMTIANLAFSLTALMPRCREPTNLAF